MRKTTEKTTESDIRETDESAKQAEGGLGRRIFLRRALAAAGGAGVFLSGLPGKAAEIPREENAKVLDRPESYVGGNILERMRKDLERALAKPVEQRHWIMMIDLEKCVGCKACTVSCEAENDLPPGVVYRPVMSEEIGSFPNVRKRFLPRPCMQCDDPPCVPVCPVGATYKRPDGVVEINYDQCIGCRYCVTACPYGARSFDFGVFHSDGTPEIPEYEKRLTYEYGTKRSRDPADRQRSPMGNARKCHFCLHRVAVGLLPACVTTCIGGATHFGDGNDPESLVSELTSSARRMRLKEELGTEPSVYYLT